MELKYDHRGIVVGVSSYFISNGLYKTNQFVRASVLKCFEEHTQQIGKQGISLMERGQITESSLSALQWATIFYYVKESKYSGTGNIKKLLKDFKDKHGLSTTIENLRTKYYQARKRINDSKDYPLVKLDSVISFLADNYPVAVTLAKNDKEFLEAEATDN